MSKEDIRNIRTKKELREGLIELLREKPFDKISVCEITDKALLSRITFYKHYADKYDLFADVISYYAKEIYFGLVGKEKIAFTKGNTVEIFLEYIRRFLHLCFQNRVILQSVIDSENQMCQFVIKRAVEDIALKLVEALSLVYQPKYPKEMITAILVGTISNYIDYKSKSGHIENGVVQDISFLESELVPILKELVTKGVLFNY